MRVLLSTEFAASRKEPLVEMHDRVLAAFRASGTEAKIRFSLSDSPSPGGVSSVDRVLKRFPAFGAFLSETAPLPPLPATRRISNQGMEAAVDPEALRSILAGVPRSFPFHNVVLTFTGPAFGDTSYKGILGEISPGVSVGDSWWVNGRNRSLAAFTFVDAEVNGKKLPPFPEPVAALFAALGKAKKTQQFPLPGENPVLAQAAKPETLEAVRDVITKYRAQLPEILERVPFPHELPTVEEARKITPLGDATGPKKPVLLRAFKPMGYDCKGESGTFTLRRRTPSHLTLEVSLDVGTWSRSLTANFSVHGLGFRAPMRLPIARHALAVMQYPIGNANRWQQLVENMAVFVKELEASFVPAVEAVADPSPEWFSPES